MVDAKLNVNIFDAIVFGMVFLSCTLSFFRGFIREFFSLAAWVGAALITLYYVVDVTAWLKPYIANGTVATIFATLGTYIVSLIGISILGRLAMKFVKEGADVGALDNILGLCFGFLKASVILILGFLIMNQVVGKDAYPDWLKTAYSLPAIEKGADIFARLMPGYMKNLNEMTQQAKEAAEQVKGAGQSTDVQTPADSGYQSQDIEDLQKLLDQQSGESNTEEAPTPAPEPFP